MAVDLEFSCAFATSLRTPEHVELAEQLGYQRAWLYDSPALYPDVWMILADCARRTSRIQIGPGVLVPSLRHPMANASALATLVHLAPGRVIAAVGSGFTGRLTLGQRPNPWAFVRYYIDTMRALLAGETAEWEGATIAMMHPPGFAPARPLHVPLAVGVAGPVGQAVAREVGDGVIASSPVGGFEWSTVLMPGTILDPGEDPGSERVIDAAGHVAALRYHSRYARGGDVRSLQGGADWLADIEAVPEHIRHLSLHEGHLVAANTRDRAVLTAEAMVMLGAARSGEAWHLELERAAAAGATEIAYQPAGADIAGELRRFAEMVGLRQ